MAYGDRWWQRPYGTGPRWLRKTWCVLLHWRHFTYLGHTQCGESKNLIPRIFRPIVGNTERWHSQIIMVYGCYTCQFPWWRTRRNETVILP